MPGTLYIGSDKRISLTGLSGDGNYLNSATVSYVLKDLTGTTITNGTLAYTAASNGNYSGVIESTVTSGLSAGSTYYLEVTITSPPYDDFRRITCGAAYRAET